MTPTQRKAMEQALDFAEHHSKYWNGSTLHPQIITANIRAALAEPQWEPKKPLTDDSAREAYKQTPGSKNCMQCAAAYMLCVPLESVPDFEQAGPDAWELFDSFFVKHGFTVEMLPPNIQIEGDYLASGRTDRGTNHMVVMRGGNLLHDPHPSGAGLTSINVVWVIARRSFTEAPQPAKRAQLTREHVRASGGIVHSDGNVFFTSVEHLNSAIEAAHDIGENE